MRGFFGDPLGKMNEIMAEDAQFRKQAEELAAEESRQNRAWSDLCTKAATLRISLQQKYREEFPAWD